MTDTIERPMPTGTLDARHSEKDWQAFTLMAQAFQTSSLSLVDTLDAFPRFATKRSIARFLAKTEIFRRILTVNGSVVECGVFNGAELFTWAHMSNIYEPTNHSRKIIASTPSTASPGWMRDNTGVLQSKVGDLRGSSIDQLRLSVAKSRAERHLSHIDNIHPVEGDLVHTSTK